MTLIPSFPPPDIVPVQAEKHIVQLREYELITPLYGGGAVAQEADPVTVVRVPSIRGQLRFWWRACRGEGALEEMRRKEASIWGMASSDKPTASKVKLSLEVTKPGIQRSWRDISGVDYAIFPLRGSDKKLVEHVRFVLRISYPEGQAADVQAALWAWETFGGLGARTRRGFGAIRCVRVDGAEVAAPANRGAVEAALRHGLKEHTLAGNRDKNLPHLTPAAQFNLTQPQSNPLQAWSSLISKLKSFRQWRTGNMGRSLWPEPDSIRAITGQSAPAHSTPVVRVRKFPRGQMGLPIIFHFRADGPRRGEPGDTSLEGANTDRFASPLILRPLAMANGAVGLGIVLEGPRAPAGGVVLKQGRRALRAVQTDLTPAEAAAITPLHGETDVFKAFLKTL